LMLLMLLPILVLLLIGMIGAGGGRLDEPICENCKYPTAGLAENRCPECGCSLEGEGTRGVGECRYIWRPPRAVVVMSACVFIALVTIPAVILFAAEGPRTCRDRLTVTLTRQDSAWSVMMEASACDVAFPWSNRDDGKESWGRDEVRLTLVAPDGTWAELWLIDRRMRARYKDLRGRTVTTRGPVNESDVAGWVERVEDRGVRESVVAQAPTMLRLLRCGASGAMMPPHPVGYTVSGEDWREWSYLTVPVVVGAVGVWGGLVAFAVRQVRRKRPKPLVIWT
jgi:hypothetical protein